MKTVIALVFLVFSGAAFGQNYPLTGEIIDEDAKPLSSAVVVLLNPSDSTLLYFSVTGNSGRFGISNIKSGKYLLQVSLLGFNTIYRQIEIPFHGSNDIGSLVMVQRIFNIKEVSVTADRIPMRIKQDTIEYDAKAYKIKPDGVAEDLIKKLPGMEVDRAGNIKAMGEDVNNVLVDGKEFFGNDTKVATRNLPADAIDKVQLFDKKSDESRFTGIDDGERNQTINLVLDDKKKKGIFGDISGGAGTGTRTEASAKIYRFTKKVQLAALGMFDNVNKLGFSLGDYISFSGGLSAFSEGGGHIIMSGDNSFPVNFGQPVYGTGSNGAAGINFSVSKSPDNRFFVSYLGNGARRKTTETSKTWNFTPGSSFRIDESRDQKTSDTTQRLNIGLRKLIGTNQNLIFNGGLSYNTSSSPLNSISGSFLNDVEVNRLQRNTSEFLERLSGNADAAYLLKIKEGKMIFKISGKADFTGNNTKSEFMNRTEYVNPYQSEVTNQFYDLRSDIRNYSGTGSFTIKTATSSFTEFSFSTGYSAEDLDRKQGDALGERVPDEGLSPDFQKTERFFRPGLTWKLANRKSQLSLSALSTFGRFESVLNGDSEVGQNYFYFIPRAYWEYEYRSGRRLMFNYNSFVSSPLASQLLPVVNNINSLSLFYGNRALKPEYVHNAMANWWLFDQFSFTSLLAGISVKYTKDKIGYIRNIDNNLAQVISLVNVGHEWNGNGNLDFSTPLKPLGIKIDLSFSESFSSGLTIVNQVENITRNFIHRVSLTIENRKKNKWDVETGSTFTLTDSRYSIQKSLNNIYQELSWFADIRYTPGVHFNFMASADITNYSAKTFKEAQVVPLIGAEINYYFLKNQRCALSLAGVDLLNRNTGIERTGEINYLMERRSSMIGRYIMLSLKYKLNKVGDNNNGVDIRIKNR